MNSEVKSVGMVRLQHVLSVLLVVFFTTGDAWGQRIPLLERVVSISITEERLDVALKKIAQQAGFTFSYNPSVIEGSRIVSYSFTNKTIREVLDQIFRGTVQYKERSRHIILTRAEVSSASKKNQKVVSGYIIDESTGQRLKNVSVYDPVSLSSAVTDAYGFFQIEIDEPTGEEVKLAVNKLNYSDTLVVVPSDGARLLKIPIKINTDRISVIADSVGQKLKRLWMATKRATEQAINMENIRDSLYRRTQISFVPFAGTNGKLSGNIINEYSFNVLGGYSLGVRKLEMGGVFNMVRGDVTGAQFAGLVNGVGGKRRGWQMAGLINATRDSSRGAQFAGLINLNWNSSGGVGAAGLFNITHRDSWGVKAAGLGNLTVGRQTGPHLAGLFNLTTGDTRPAQLAGLFNFTTGTMYGAQVAGLFNVATKTLNGAQVSGWLNVAAGEVKGAQVSGLLNIAAGDMRGAQIAGWLNYATRIRGTQIGVLNISDSIQGIPVGILSFVRRGYHKIEVSADEVFYTNVAFRTGVRQFYNIINAGMKPRTFEGDNIWTVGYGFGTAPRLNRWLYLNFDVTANQVIRGNDADEINMINKLYVGVDMQASKHFSVTLGVTLNGHITDTNYTEYPELFTDYKPDFFYDHTYSNDKNMKMWLGAKIGLRFL